MLPQVSFNPQLTMPAIFGEWLWGNQKSSPLPLATSGPADPLLHIGYGYGGYASLVAFLKPVHSSTSNPFSHEEWCSILGPVTEESYQSERRWRGPLAGAEACNGGREPGKYTLQSLLLPTSLLPALPKVPLPRCGRSSSQLLDFSLGFCPPTWLFS